MSILKNSNLIQSEYESYLTNPISDYCKKRNIKQYGWEIRIRFGICKNHNRSNYVRKEKYWKRWQLKYYLLCWNCVLCLYTEFIKLINRNYKKVKDNKVWYRHQYCWNCYYDWLDLQIISIPKSNNINNCWSQDKNYQTVIQYFSF